MPCRDEWASRDTEQANACKVNELTALLCSFCKAYENHDFPNVKMPLAVKQWWKEHKEADKRREKAEKDAKLATAARLLKQRRDINKQLSELGYEQ
jgi:hypothetical protein